MVYEDEEPDVRDPNYDESSQVSESNAASLDFGQLVHRCKLNLTSYKRENFEEGHFFLMNKWFHFLF